MSTYLIKGDTLTDIAKSIKTKTGKASQSIKGQDFAKEINSIPTYIDGTIPTTDITSITPGTKSQKIPAGVYTAKEITIQGDPNLTPENIAHGVTIFGVTGSNTGARYNIINDIYRRTTTEININGTLDAIMCKDGKLYGAGYYTNSSKTFYKFYEENYNGVYGPYYQAAGAQTTSIIPTGIAYNYVLDTFCVGGNGGNYYYFESAKDRFKGSSNGLQHWEAYANYPLRVCSMFNIGNQVWFCGRNDTFDSGNPCGMIGWSRDSIGSRTRYSASFPLFVSGCDYNGFPIAISNDMVWMFASTTDTPRRAAFKPEKTESSIKLTKCQQLNNMLCIIGSNDSATYLYYTSQIIDGTDYTTNKTTMVRRKIADEKLNIFGMFYIGGLYVIIGVNSSGESKVWQTTRLESDGHSYDKLLLEDKYVVTATTSDGNNIYVVSAKGTDMKKYITKIDMAV